MAKVAREMVERTGVNVDQLVELLVKNAAAELTTFSYSTILRVTLIGLEGEGIQAIAETARIEDRNHFEALVPRIHELDGKLPDAMKLFHDLSACPPARLPKNPRDLTAMLTVLVEAERCAVRGHAHICKSHRRQGPPDVRSVPGDPQPGGRARSRVLRVPGRGSLWPLPASR